MIRNSDIDRLRGLFAKRLIATMDMLKKTVGTVADLTVFRKLRELDYCTSYSHRGRFYTLRELAEFDENGLWWIRSVGFSSRGTLVATAEGLVNASEAGYAVEELDAIVRVGTKDVLPKLAWEKRLRRTRIRNRNVYFSPKRSIREQQIASRRVWEAQPSVSKSIAAQDVLPDELKAAIILFFSRRCCTARSKSLTSLCRLQSHPAQYVSGIPSAAILLSISHPIRCSTRCLANVRARISGPMIAL